MREMFKAMMAEQVAAKGPMNAENLEALMKELGAVLMMLAPQPSYVSVVLRRPAKTGCACGRDHEEATITITNEDRAGIDTVAAALLGAYNEHAKGLN